MEVVRTKKLGGYIATRFCNGNLQLTSLSNSAQSLLMRAKKDWVLKNGVEILNSKNGSEMPFTVAWMDSLAEYLEKQPEGTEIILAYHNSAPKLIGKPDVMIHATRSPWSRAELIEMHVDYPGSEGNLIFYRIQGLTPKWTSPWIDNNGLGVNFDEAEAIYLEHTERKGCC